MHYQQLLQALESNPDQVTFDQVISVIDNDYTFTPSRFTNGGLTNEAGVNSGSCKIFAFARRHGLTRTQTLHCFGDYYRRDVLNNPDSMNHQNIRHFIDTGWEGIFFSNEPLQEKSR